MDLPLTLVPALPACVLLPLIKPILAPSEEGKE
jgi:hypothetical protein